MITAFLYDQKTEEMKSELTREEIRDALADPDKLLWLDMEDPAEADYELLKDPFDFHPLLIQDTINPQNLPKCNEMENYFFMVLHSVYYYTTKREEEALNIREIDIFAGRNYVVTVHNGHIKTVTLNRDLCRRSCKIMTKGSGLLLYYILDTMVENYVAIINTLNDKLNSLEDAVVEESRPELLGSILSLKRNIMTMRRVLLPQSELFYQLCHGKISFVQKDAIIYFRDIYDHMTRIANLVDNLREMGQALLEAYRSTLSMKLNDVMKVLTVIMTIMMPMSVVAGVGGMNVGFPFRLRETMVGFWALMAIMAAAAAALLVWFHKKRLL